jgi:NAD(P)-dependent dehydrogenase (short-subunit alcohol dehydrogenase family)
VAISSDVGTALARRWLGRGCQISGTFRVVSRAVEDLANRAALVCCDLADSAAIGQASRRLSDLGGGWDALVLCSGNLEPIGPFIENGIDAWEESLRVNCTGPLRLVHDLLPFRSRDSELGPCVLFFAGAGTNGPAVNYSAYTAAKITLIKMCELLDAEVPDTRFTILGTGWVKTKIHEATLQAGARAGQNYQRTLEKMAGEDWTPLERVLDCCDWVMRSPRAVVGGRNFSVVHDRWGSPALAERLVATSDTYKLRRSGNDWRPGAEAPPQGKVEYESEPVSR